MFRAVQLLVLGGLLAAPPALGQGTIVLLSDSGSDAGSVGANARLKHELRVDGYAVENFARGWRCSSKLRDQLLERTALAAVELQQSDGELVAKVCILRPFDGLLVNASPTRRTDSAEELSMVVLEALHGGSLREELRFSAPLDEETPIRVNFVQREPTPGFQLGAGAVVVLGAGDVSPLVGPTVVGEYTFNGGVRLGAELSTGLLGGAYDPSDTLPETDLRVYSPRLRLGHAWAGRAVSPYLNLQGGLFIVHNTRVASSGIRKDTALLPIFGASFGLDFPIGDFALRAELGVSTLSRALELNREAAEPIRFGVPTTNAAFVGVYRF